MFNTKFISVVCALFLSLFCLDSVAQATLQSNTLSGTLPGNPTQFLGSSNGADVLFKSSNVERMRLLSTGNFGIGNSAPQTRLHLTTAGSNDGLRITQTGQTAASIYLQNTSVGGNQFALFSTGAQNTQGAGKLLFHDFNGNQTRMTLVGGTGYLGIGTYNPQQLLHVSGNILIDGASSGMLFGETAGGPTFGHYGIEYQIGDKGLNFFKPWGSFNNGGGQGFQNNILFLNDDGKIGLGVSPAVLNAPGYAHRLSVCGSIRATEVVVEVGWCDYVFSKEYTLRPISELKSFIEENHHLPDVTSGEVVESEGLKLAEMSAMHMKKIEELTLYLIQQNESLETMKAELERLKSELAELKK